METIKKELPSREFPRFMIDTCNMAYQTIITAANDNRDHENNLQPVKSICDDEKWSADRIGEVLFAIRR
jgi:hypothetical protein